MPYYLSNRNYLGKLKPNVSSVSYIGESAATGLSGIFTGASNTFVYRWANRWTGTSTQPSSGWQEITGNIGHFVSGIRLTAEPTASGIGNILRSNVTPYFNADRTLASVIAPQGTDGYNTSNALDFNTDADGAWLGSVDSRTLEFTFGSSQTNFGNATGFIIQGFSSGGYHKCLVMSITHASITRYFAPKWNVGLVSTGAPVCYFFYPLNNSFTSFTDSRLTSATGGILSATYFEY